MSPADLGSAPTHGTAARRMSVPPDGTVARRASWFPMTPWHAGHPHFHFDPVAGNSGGHGDL